MIPVILGKWLHIFYIFPSFVRPYKKLIHIIKQSTQFFSQAEIFREDIENALELDSTLKDISHGLVCHTVKKEDSKKYELNPKQNKDIFIYESTNLDEIKKISVGYR